MTHTRKRFDNVINLCTLLFFYVNKTLRKLWMLYKSDQSQLIGGSFYTYLNSNIFREKVFNRYGLRSCPEINPFKIVYGGSQLPCGKQDKRTYTYPWSDTFGNGWITTFIATLAFLTNWVGLEHLFHEIQFLWASNHFIGWAVGFGVSLGRSDVWFACIQLLEATWLTKQLSVYKSEKDL